MCKRQLPNILIMDNFDLRKYLAENKLVKGNIQDEDLLSDAIDILDEFRVYAKSEDFLQSLPKTNQNLHSNLIKYLNTSINTYLGKPLSILKSGKKLVDDDASSIIQGVADGLNPFTGKAFDYEVDNIQSDLERLIN